MHSDRAADFTDAIASNLPYLRRYARALTGSQTTGDRYAAATLEVILASGTAALAGLSAKVALFHTFHKVWSSAGAPERL